MNEEIIYISVNNWFYGRDYPKLECFRKWLGDDLNQTFRNDSWAKENKLCINYGVIDMSWNYCISAPREWVERECPKLLGDEEYTYALVSVGKDGEKRTEYTKKYSDFVFHPDGDGDVEDKFGWSFPEYKEENFGCHYYQDPNEYWDDNEEEDE